MKKTLIILLICFLLPGFIGQTYGKKMTGQQKSNIEKQIDFIFHNMIKAAESLDYDQLNTGVDDSNNAGFIINGLYFTKYDSLVNVLKANKQDGAKQSIKIQNEKITVLSDSIVLLTASGEAKVELNSSQTFTIKFLWSFIYEKINDEWKVIQSHQSQAK